MVFATAPVFFSNGRNSNLRKDEMVWDGLGWFRWWCFLMFWHVLKCVSLLILMGRWSQVSSVIYFRHNDMQDRVVKLGKWHRTAVAEARGRFFVFFFGGSSRKQMLCNHFLHIIHSLDISFLPLNILAMRSCPFRKYRTCMLKETSISL